MSHGQIHIDFFKYNLLYEFMVILISGQIMANISIKVISSYRILEYNSSVSLQLYKNYIENP